MRTPLAVAGGARHLGGDQLGRGFGLGTRLAGTGAGVDPHQRRSQSRRQVQWSRIVRDHQVDPPQHRRQLQQAGRSRQVHGWLAHRGDFRQHLLGQGLLGPRADGNHRPSRLADCPPKLRGRPALGLPARAGVDRHQWPGEIFEQVLDPVVLLAGHPQLESRPVAPPAQPVGQSSHPLESGTAACRAWDNLVAGPARPFPGGLQPNSQPRSREPGQHSRAEQPLQVDDPVEPLGPQSPQQPQVGPEPRPAFEVQRGEPAGVSFQQPGQLAIDDPRQFHVGIQRAEHPRQGQRLGDIAQGTRLDHDNPARCGPARSQRGEGESGAHGSHHLRRPSQPVRKFARSRISRRGVNPAELAGQIDSCPNVRQLHSRVPPCSIASGPPRFGSPPVRQPTGPAAHRSGSPVAKSDTLADPTPEPIPRGRAVEPCLCGGRSSRPDLTRNRTQTTLPLALDPFGTGTCSPRRSPRYFLQNAA